MDTLEVLKQNVERLCNERGWTQKRLAKEMGVAEPFLSRTLSGNPQLKTLEKIAKALDVSVKSLFDDPDDIEGFILLHGTAYHFNSKIELNAIEEQANKRKTIDTHIILKNK